MNQTPWFILAYTFSVMLIAVYFIRKYILRNKVIKENIHAIRTCIDLIDKSLEDESVTKEEFVALVKRCLVVINDLFP